VSRPVGFTGLDMGHRFGVTGVPIPGSLGDLKTSSVPYSSVMSPHTLLSSCSHYSGSASPLLVQKQTDPSHPRLPLPVISLLLVT
jgi:hypothetical protein